MRKKCIHSIVQNSRGFSLLEVLMGVTVFMIGMLGVTALNISSLKSNTFSGNMSEAVIIAGDRLEILMATEFDDPDCYPPVKAIDDPECNPEWPLSDKDGDGTDEDLLPAGPPVGDNIDDNGGNFGLDDTGNDGNAATVEDADHSDPGGPIDPASDPGVGKNNMYYVYWNVAIGEPLPEKTKTVNVIVEWYIKDVKRTMNMSTIIVKQ